MCVGGGCYSLICSVLKYSVNFASNRGEMVSPQFLAIQKLPLIMTLSSSPDLSPTSCMYTCPSYIHRRLTMTPESETLHLFYSETLNAKGSVLHTFFFY